MADIIDLKTMDKESSEDTEKIVFDEENLSVFQLIGSKHIKQLTKLFINFIRIWKHKGIVVGPENLRVITRFRLEGDEIVLTQYFELAKTE